VEGVEDGPGPLGADDGPHHLVAGRLDGRWRLDAVLARVEAKLAELTALRGRIVQAREACEAGCCMFTAP